MTHELKTHRLMQALEKQRAIHLENWKAHKKQATFSEQSAEACLISITALDIELVGLENADEESK